VKTSYVGSLLREGCLMLDLSITTLYLMIALIFLGRVFGGKRSPLRVVFLAWTATHEMILTMDNVRK
jgi:hypothetical protein